MKSQGKRGIVSRSNHAQWLRLMETSLPLAATRSYFVAGNKGIARYLWVCAVGFRHEASVTQW